MKQVKTNAVRLLEKAGVKFELITYQVDEDNLDACHVASDLNEDVNKVFKTLVLSGDSNGIFVCVVSAGSNVNLKAAAKVSKNKNASLIAVKQLLPLTGYIRGGCSPIGMKKTFPVFVDKSCMDFDYIYISGGVRGLQIKINPLDLIQFINAEIAEITG